MLTPVNEPIVKSTSIRRIHGRVREVLADGRWILVQIHDQLRQKPWRRRKLAHEQLVQTRNIYRSLMYSLRDLEDEVIRRLLSQ